MAQQGKDRGTSPPHVWAARHNADVPTDSELSPRRRRWLVAWALFRSTATATLIVATYYLAPLQGRPQKSALVLLGVTLAALIGLVSWQVWTIIHSRYPRVRAIEALFTSVPFLLLSYATAYYLMGQDDHTNFTQRLTRTDAIYFTVTVFATVGFGDISAATETARLVVASQMLLDLLVFGLGLRVFLSAVRIGQKRRSQS